MSLQSEYGSSHNQEDINRYGKRMLDKYGLLACQEANELDSTSLSKGSLSSYKPQVRHIISETGVSDPNIEDALKVIQDCDKQGSTKSIMVSAIKKYYEAIGEIDKAENFHTKAKKSDIDSEAFSGGMEIDEWLTVDEVESIDDHLLPDDSEERTSVVSSGKEWIFNLEHKAMFETLYYTGCRVGEIVLLNLDDFDFDTNEVRVYRLKKGGEDPKRDMVAIPDTYCSTMKAYLEYADISSGKVFNYTTRTIQTRMKEISDAYIFTFGDFKHASKLTPHKLRHARVTAIANSSGLDKAGEFVDHSSVDTTKAYRHLAVEDQRDILPEEQGDDKEELIKALAAESDIDAEVIANAISEAE